MVKNRCGRHRGRENQDPTARCEAPPSYSGRSHQPFQRASRKPTTADLREWKGASCQLRVPCPRRLSASPKIPVVRRLPRIHSQARWRQLNESSCRQWCARSSRPPSICPAPPACPIVFVESHRSSVREKTSRTTWHLCRDRKIPPGG